MMMAKRAGAGVKIWHMPISSYCLNSKHIKTIFDLKALRGEGAILLDKQGLSSIEKDTANGELRNPEEYSFMKSASELGSLATRDIVARTIDQNLKESGESEVYLYTSTWILVFTAKVPPVRHILQNSI